MRVTRDRQLVCENWREKGKSEPVSAGTALARKSCSSKKSKQTIWYTVRVTGQTINGLYSTTHKTAVQPQSLGVCVNNWKYELNQGELLRWSLEKF